MELALLVWFIGAIESVKFTCMTIIVCTGTYFLRQIIEEEKFNKWLVTLFTASVILAVVTPSTKTAWMMTAAYAGQSMVQSETAKKLGVLIEKKLEGLMEEADSQAAGKIKETVK